MYLNVYGQPESASSGRVDRSVKRLTLKLYSICTYPYNPQSEDMVDKTLEYRRFVYFFIDFTSVLISFAYAAW